jgi:AcrR family transcriptional regulator
MVARAERQELVRRRILEAMKEAVKARPYPAIRLADIARAAGVSTPTVHAHFDTKEVLFLAAMAELGPEVLALRGRPAPGDVRGIVRGLVRGYEPYGDANWGLLPLEQDSETVAAVLRQGRAGHRAWLEEVFAPLLPAGGAARRAVVDALYAATDVGTWKLLRRDLGLSRARTNAAMEALVRGVLSVTGQQER